MGSLSLFVCHFSIPFKTFLKGKQSDVCVWGGGGGMNVLDIHFKTPDLPAFIIAMTSFINTVKKLNKTE